MGDQKSDYNSLFYNKKKGSRNLKPQNFGAPKAVVKNANAMETKTFSSQRLRLMYLQKVAEKNEQQKFNRTAGSTGESKSSGIDATFPSEWKTDDRDRKQTPGFTKSHQWVKKTQRPLPTREREHEMPEALFDEDFDEAQEQFEYPDQTNKATSEPLQITAETVATGSDPISAPKEQNSSLSRSAKTPLQLPSSFFLTETNVEEEKSQSVKSKAPFPVKKEQSVVITMQSKTGAVARPLSKNIRITTPSTAGTTMFGHTGTLPHPPLKEEEEHEDSRASSAYTPVRTPGRVFNVELSSATKTSTVTRKPLERRAVAPHCRVPGGDPIISKEKLPPATNSLHPLANSGSAIVGESHLEPAPPSRHRSRRQPSTNKIKNLLMQQLDPLKNIPLNQVDDSIGNVFCKAMEIDRDAMHQLQKKSVPLTVEMASIFKASSPKRQQGSSSADGEETAAQGEFKFTDDAAVNAHQKTLYSWVPRKTPVFVERSSFFSNQFQQHQQSFPHQTTTAHDEESPRLHQMQQQHQQQMVLKSQFRHIQQQQLLKLNNEIMQQQQRQRKPPNEHPPARRMSLTTTLTGGSEAIETDVDLSATKRLVAKLAPSLPEWYSTPAVAPDDTTLDMFPHILMLTNPKSHTQQTIRRELLKEAAAAKRAAKQPKKAQTARNLQRRMPGNAHAPIEKVPIALPVVMSSKEGFQSFAAETDNPDFFKFDQELVKEIRNPVAPAHSKKVTDKRVLERFERLHLGLGHSQSSEQLLKQHFAVARNQTVNTVKVQIDKEVATYSTQNRRIPLSSGPGSRVLAETQNSGNSMVARSEHSSSDVAGTEDGNSGGDSVGVQDNSQGVQNLFKDMMPDLASAELDNNAKAFLIQTCMLAGREEVQEEEEEPEEEQELDLTARMQKAGEFVVQTVSRRRVRGEKSGQVKDTKTGISSRAMMESRDSSNSPPVNPQTLKYQDLNALTHVKVTPAKPFQGVLPYRRSADGLIHRGPRTAATPEPISTKLFEKDAATLLSRGSVTVPAIGGNRDAFGRTPRKVADFQEKIDLRQTLKATEAQFDPTKSETKSTGVQDPEDNDQQEQTQETGKSVKRREYMTAEEQAAADKAEKLVLVNKLNQTTERIEQCIKSRDTLFRAIHQCLSEQNRASKTMRSQQLVVTIRGRIQFLVFRLNDECSKIIELIRQWQKNLCAIRDFELAEVVVQTQPVYLHNGKDLMSQVLQDKQFLLEAPEVSRWMKSVTSEPNTVRLVQ